MHAKAPPQYSAMSRGTGFADAGPRTLITLAGRDAAAFLHNLSTNDIQRLAPGQGCEAFITTVQGKTLGHVLVFRNADDVVLDTSPGQAATLLAHFDRYIIREDVTLIDQSSELSEYWLSGATADSLVHEQLGLELPVRYAHQAADWSGMTVTVRRVDWLGTPSFLLCVPRQQAASLADSLGAAGVPRGSIETVETLRIENGSPEFGRDVTADNLPQEVQRDALAISFVKGCYLGQETVARLDALGHVNKLLVGVKFDADSSPQAGCELRSDARCVGRVTSLAFSPRLDAPLGMAYVRRGHHEPGRRLASESGEAEIVALPLAGN